MAIAVPLLMGAMGVGATTIAITSIAFTVTGINKAIDKAAANVFGEDLVKLANLAGMAYGMFGGGFGGGFNIGEGASAAAGGAELVSSTPELTTSAWDAMSAADTAALTSAVPDATSMVNTVSSMPPSVSDLASAPTVAPLPPVKPAQFNLAQKAAETTNKFVPQATAESSVVPGLRAGTGAPGFQPTNNATTSQFSPGYNASSSVASGNIAPSLSFMEKLQNLATTPLAVTGAIQGVAGAYSSAQNRAAQQDELDKREARAKLGANGWKQTFRTA